MKYDIFNKDITLKELKDSEEIKFLNELVSDENAKKEAIDKLFIKSLINVASEGKLVKAIGDQVTFINTASDKITLVIRKPYEMKIASLDISLVDYSMTVTVSINGAEKAKTFTEESLLKEVFKAFDSCIKTLEK